MRTWKIVTGLAAALAALLAATAAAEDNQAGTPLVPADAAGPWTVSAGGRDLCVLTLGRDRSVRAPTACADALPAQPTAWQTTADGMRLIGPGGAPLIAFNRWSNSLLVSHRASGVDVQLRRGAAEG
jgi:hypothetical protein